MDHRIENTGETEPKYLEVFKAPRHQGFPLRQWMALAPHQLVGSHLKIDRGVIDRPTQKKRPVTGV